MELGFIRFMSDVDMEMLIANKITVGLRADWQNLCMRCKIEKSVDSRLFSQKHYFLAERELS